MFLFDCCRNAESRTGYTVKKRNQDNQQTTTFLPSLSQIPQNELKDPSTRIFKIDKSEFQNLLKQYHGTDKKWTDPNFPPTDMSLGNIESGLGWSWKRISDLIEKPTLFEGKIQPTDVVQGTYGDCYFLSAVSALAQKQERIKSVFGNQEFNPHGFYRVTLRIRGIIEQFVIDDYIPVNSYNQPLFCQPNKNEIWVQILEKAWAKARGSYSNILSGNQAEVFKAVTYAPSQVYTMKDNEVNRTKIWKIIQRQAEVDSPACFLTKQGNHIDWQKIGLFPGRTYTMIIAGTLQFKSGRSIQMLILRNPFGFSEWQGEGSEKDEEFWFNIKPSERKSFFLQHKRQINDGIFFITYKDLYRYFERANFCFMQPNANYINEDLFPNRKNGKIYSFSVEKTGHYSFQLHQDHIDTSKLEDNLSRSTLLVAKIAGKDYRFIGGVMDYNKEDTLLQTDLEPGQYLLYTKFDPTQKYHKMPEIASVSVYSTQFVCLTTTDQKNHPMFLEKVFMSHAKLNKRQTYNNDLMWVSWKLLFQQGGYSYIALGNAQESQSRFLVTFDQSQFNEQNLKLKKPFKGKGDGQVVIVEPGNQKIILARVKNVVLKSLKLPSHIDIKIQKINDR